MSYCCLREIFVFSLYQLPLFCRATRSPNRRRVARPMGRVPLPPQIAFFPCTSQSQDSSKTRLPREILGHWSIELLCMTLGRLDGPADLAIQYLFLITLKLTGASKESQYYSPSVLIGDKDLFGDQELRWKCQLNCCST
ncbi:hypothetical protein TNCV_3059621 [Trichonephila clavipes]|nr:hypothetical protein TNCV_3059621 [Trichonephila clavipes]